MLKLSMIFLQCWLGFCFTASAWAIDPEDLLQPDEAFQLHAELKDANNLLLNWDIADGYYLYRHKIKFVSLTPGVQAGQPVFPAGQTKQDRNFGSVEVYRDQLQVELPIQRQQAKAVKLELEVTFQGCADIGICYMPIQKVIAFDLPDRTVTSQSKALPPG